MCVPQTGSSWCSDTKFFANNKKSRVIYLTTFLCCREGLAIGVTGGIPGGQDGPKYWPTSITNRPSLWHRHLQLFFILHSLNTYNLRLVKSLSFILLLAICIHSHSAYFLNIFCSVFWNVFLRTSDVQCKKRYIWCNFFVIIQNNVKCMGIFPSRPLIGRYVRCIEWATRRVLNGPRAVYWVGQSDSNSLATFSPQSAPVVNMGLKHIPCMMQYTLPWSVRGFCLLHMVDFIKKKFF